MKKIYKFEKSINDVPFQGVILRREKSHFITLTEFKERKHFKTLKAAFNFMSKDGYNEAPEIELNNNMKNTIYDTVEFMVSIPRTAAGAPGAAHSITQEILLKKISKYYHNSIGIECVTKGKQYIIHCKPGKSYDIYRCLNYKGTLQGDYIYIGF